MNAPQRLDDTLARVRLEQCQLEINALKCGRVRNYTAPGRQPAVSVAFWPPCLGPSEESSSIGGDVVATGEL